MFPKKRKIRMDEEEQEEEIEEHTCTLEQEHIQTRSEKGTRKLLLEYYKKGVVKEGAVLQPTEKGSAWKLWSAAVCASTGRRDCKYCALQGSRRVWRQASTSWSSAHQNLFRVVLGDGAVQEGEKDTSCRAQSLL